MAKILIVDDERTVALALQRVLGDTHTVTLAQDGEKAWQILQKNSTFDVIFCDILMPRRTGVELYQQVHAADPSLAKKIVFLVGGGYSPSLSDFLQTVSNAKLAKPFDLVGVQDLLARLLAFQASPAGG